MSEAFLPLKMNFTEQVWFTHPNRNVLIVMLALLKRAKYRKGSFLGVMLERGQAVIGIGNGKRVGEFTEMLAPCEINVGKVRYALDTLEKLGEIKQEGRQGQYTIITIVHFDDYIAAFKESKAETKNEAETTASTEPETDDEIDWGKVQETW